MARLVRCLIPLMLMSCTSGLNQVRVKPELQASRDAFLVKIIKVMPTRAVRLVSFASLELDTEGDMPAMPSAGQMASMRGYAGAAGANFLFVERLDLPWRRAFFASGLRLDPKGAVGWALASCDGSGMQSALENAREGALACLKLAAESRPALKGRMEIRFQLDATGKVKRALPDTQSSRDGQIQQCVYQHLFETSYPKPKGALCSGTFKVSLP
jgi:hypothetical protein